MRKGATEITGLMIGSNAVDKIYKGATELWAASNGGEAIFTTVQTHNWVCPEGVTSVCVVAIGGGGGGMHYAPNAGTWAMSGGTGGGLGWKNNIPVTPGNTYTVVVGASGISGVYSNGGTDGGDSYFIDATTVKGGKGLGGKYNLVVAGGTYTGDGGGNGGGIRTPASLNAYGPQGGCGAGGYSGNGGDNGFSTVQTPTAGTGGAGGGGGNNGSNLSYGGGGTGLLGEGTSGAANNTGPGFGGSGGANGVDKIGGEYGGGAGSQTTVTAHTSPGGQGAVRIIWGEGRAFPSTDCDQTSSGSITIY